MGDVAIIGGGPAGLMAAEMLSKSGFNVSMYERKPSLGRKFLMAGRGGLNLTHSEPIADFMTRYREAAPWLAPALDAFTPVELRNWCEGLGEETFVGSSGRVFPKSFKASPLLRAWTQRLADQGVRFYMQRTWQGWDSNGALVFIDALGQKETAMPDATLLALGGASWPKLGADGGWAQLLEGKGVALSPLRAANCGFEVAWSDILRTKFAGQPLKPVGLTAEGVTVQGEAMIAERGIEGGAVYALSAILREKIAATGAATLEVDLKPGVFEDTLAERLAEDRRAQTFSNFLRKQIGLSPAAVGLLNENQQAKNLPARELAQLVKKFPITLTAPFPIDRAISTAGGIKQDAVDANLMLKKLPGVFAAGEMLDWEAPTGGYLLQACFSTGVLAASGIAQYLRKNTAKAG